MSCRTKSKLKHEFIGSWRPCASNEAMLIAPVVGHVEFTSFNFNILTVSTGHYEHKKAVTSVEVKRVDVQSTWSIFARQEKVIISVVKDVVISQLCVLTLNRPRFNRHPIYPVNHNYILVGPRDSDDARVCVLTERASRKTMRRQSCRVLILPEVVARGVHVGHHRVPSGLVDQWYSIRVPADEDIVGGVHVHAFKSGSAVIASVEDRKPVAATSSGIYCLTEPDKVSLISYQLMTIRVRRQIPNLLGVPFLLIWGNIWFLFAL